MVRKRLLPSSARPRLQLCINAIMAEAVVGLATSTEADLTEIRSARGWGQACQPAWFHSGSVRADYGRDVHWLTYCEQSVHTSSQHCRGRPSTRISQIVFASARTRSLMRWPGRTCICAQ
jgi:hypothetical protein